MGEQPSWDEVAAIALRSYGLDGASMTRAGGASNTNFRVDAGGWAYLLRLHTAGEHDRAAIRSELEWLRSLRADTPLVLPEPVPAGDGELVASVAVGRWQNLLCTLLTWVEGQIPPTAEALSAAQLASAGAAMGQLHRYAQASGLPGGFVRPSYDAAYFASRLAQLVRSVRQAAFDQETLGRFHADAGTLIQQLAHLERRADSFGVIHADFHSGNYVLDGDAVRIIDFDRCGSGFYLHDLALALMELDEAQQRLFLEGYASIAPLPEGHPGRTGLFLCLAYIDNLGFLAAREEEWPFVLGELPGVVALARQEAVRVASSAGT
ncbi:MAG: phosphotransferase [Roseiflexaceae bacterium]